MIQPAQRSAALLNDIETTRPAAGAVAIWWLGQSGYAIKTAFALAYTDLYLSEHLTAKYANTAKPHIRMTESPLRPDEVTNARWVFASHKHSDHLDPGTLPPLFEASPDARLILPAAHVDHAISLGLARDRLLPMRGDDTLDAGPIHVHSFPAAHPDLDYDRVTGYPFLGFGLEMNGIRIYHSGDTVVYEGLVERLRAFQPHIALLPINGRAGGAGTPPNMNAAEAVELAQAVSVPLVIPHHYDMFTFNTADVGAFMALAQAQGVPFRVLHCGERFLWRV